MQFSILKYSTFPHGNTAVFLYPQVPITPRKEVYLCPCVHVCVHTGMGVRWKGSAVGEFSMSLTDFLISFLEEVCPLSQICSCCKGSSGPRLINHLCLRGIDLSNKNSLNTSVHGTLIRILKECKGILQRILYNYLAYKQKQELYRLWSSAESDYFWLH